MYHELPEHKAAVSISVELIHLHLVDLDRSIHLIAQGKYFFGGIFF